MMLTLFVSQVMMYEAYAEQTVSTSLEQSRISSQGGDYLLQLMTGLIIVIACIVVLAWFARRMNNLQSSHDGNLQILGGLSMGARERIVLIQVGEQQLLLGVAPGRINTLHVLGDASLSKEQIATASAGASEFGHRLMQKMKQATSSTCREGDA